MPLVLLFLALLAASAATAQEVEWQRFYPLAEGDTWTYGFSERTCPLEPGACSTDASRTVRRTVVGTAEVEGVERPLVRVEVWNNPEGEPCVADYAVWLDEATAEVQIAPQGPTCQYAYRDAPEANHYVEQAPLDGGNTNEEEVLIGGIPYALVTLYASGGGGLNESQLTLGLDVGLVDLDNFFYLSGSGETTTISYGLEYAEVGGETYGVPIVSSEGGAAPTAFGLGAPYPNPARGAVRFAVSLPGPDAVTVEAFDLLGRRVFEENLGVQPAGETAHRLDLAGLPPGLYLVRATAASGERATRRLTKAE
ncbi:MAG: T9SS type A sorting domain-containing protein [Rhodothermales bacterium]|nr:T9SS type A sorting domain-containing protein [Rhodothermales bacterium]